MSERVLLHVDRGVATLTLNRPDKANAVDLPTARALGEAASSVADDVDVDVVVVLGAGARFCAGGDVGSMTAATDTAAFVEELASTLDAAVRCLSCMAKPVVVGVQGVVAGAGLAVMLSGDLVVAAEGTRFVTAYADVGLTPDCGVSWLLPRAVGQQRALELLLTRRVLTAEEALEWGLVTEVADSDAAAGRAVEVARQLAAGPALALGQSRRLVRGAWESDRDATGLDEARTIAAMAVHPDTERLLQGFVNRRQA